MIDLSVLLACFISLFGVSLLTWATKSVYREDTRLRYLINFLWFCQVFIWVSVTLLWG